jgi:hypothetical protein
MWSTELVELKARFGNSFKCQVSPVMKSMFLVLVAWVTLTVPGNAQNNPAVERHTTRGFSAVEASRNQMAEQECIWQSARKLTVLEKVPPRSPDQGRSMALSTLQNNTVGYLDYWVLKVVQVVGPTDSLLALDNPNLSPIWLADYPTDQLADDDRVTLIGPVEVAGTRSYETTLGVKKTVRVVRFVPRERVPEVEAEMESKRKAAVAEYEALMKEKRKKAAAGEFRVWTDKSGDRTFSGSFHGLKNGQVTLEREEDQKTFDVSLSRLSKDDQKWIRDELKRRKATK